MENNMTNFKEYLSEKGIFNYNLNAKNFTDVIKDIVKKNEKVTEIVFDSDTSTLEITTNKHFYDVSE
jgi:hypothetical protein